MNNRRQNWTYDETVVALYLFCTIPFNECRASHPIIYETAILLGRSPAALNMKIGNFGRLDPSLADKGISGLKNGSSLDKIVWDDFYGDFSKLALRYEQILCYLHGNVPDLDIEIPDGIDVSRMTKQRINQEFFRRMVVSSYNNKCCITGISNEKLIEACHISDWSKDENNRTNPHNGLALTPTLHKAYDSLLIAVTPDFKVTVSKRILGDPNIEAHTSKFFNDINGFIIRMPDRFTPSRELLDQHYQKFLTQSI